MVILIAMIRLVASPVFLWFEYHRPDPADQFGLETEDRLTLDPTAWTNSLTSPRRPTWVI